MTEKTATAAVAEIVPDTKRFHDLEASAIKMARDIETGYVDLAETLAGIDAEFQKCSGRPTLAKKELGFPNFEEWAETKLGCGYRRARYMVKIWTGLHETVGIPKRDIQKLGSWTKAKELAPLVAAGKLTKANFPKWAERASETETEKFKADVKRAVKQEHDQPAPVVEVICRETIGLYCGDECADGKHEGQHQNFKAAMETAAKLTGSDKRPHQLDMICLEFNASHQPENEDREVAIARLCARMEEIFGVKTIVIDLKSKEVLRGQDEVKSLT